MQAKLELLLKEVDSKMKMFGNTSDRHKTMHRRFRYAAFSFTALSSFLAGAALYAPNYQMTLNILLLAISAISGAVASIEGMRKPDELWIHERMFFYMLSDLKREITYESSDGISVEQLDKYFRRLQNLLESSGDKWSNNIVGTPDIPEVEP